MSGTTPSSLAQEIMRRLKQVLPSSGQVIALHEPYFAGQEWRYVKECIDTGWVSSAGPFVEQFERKLAEFTGMRYAIAVINGSAALHAALLAADVQRQDEVITPALTFVATANAVHYCGAIPHLADSCERTLGLDPQKLREHLQAIAVLRDGSCINRHTGRRIRAVVPMHTLGHPSRLAELAEVCADYLLVMVEDAAEALGSRYQGRHIGSWGRLAAFSFNGNKIMTAGGGGAIVTNSEPLARAVRHLTTTAKVPHRWHYVHDAIGYNYRLPNLNAALALAQLEQMPMLLDRKRKLALAYARAFEGAVGVKFYSEPQHCRSNYWLNGLLLEARHAGQLESILELTHQEGIMTRPLWTPLHQLPMLKDAPRMNLATAESLATRMINIPSSAFLIEQTRRA